MTRKDFITELEKLLWELPEDERAEAISYYENYFDDGEIKEEDIVSSKVDSPVSIANSIKDDYFANNPNAIRNQRNTSFETAEPFSYDYGNHTTSDDKSFANENKATSSFEENKTNAYANLNEEKTTSSNKNGPYFYSSEGVNSKKTNDKDFKQEFYGQVDGGEYEEDPSKSKIANLWGKFKYWFNKQETIIKVLIIVGIVAVCIGISPVIGTILGAVLAVVGSVVGLILAVFATIFGLICAGIGMAIGGAVLVIVGLATLVSELALGILYVGMGLFLIAFGIALSVVSVKLMGVTFRFTVKSSKQFYHYLSNKAAA